MLFFVLLVVVALLTYPVTRSWPQRMRYALAAALFLIGSDHWLTPDRYLAMMPPWIPLHLELVLFTGAAEIAGGLGLLLPAFRPAVDGLPQAAWYYWARLPFQPLAVWWALYSAELIRWPFKRAGYRLA